MDSVSMGVTSCACVSLPHKKTTPVKKTARNELKQLLIIWIFVGFQKGINKLTALSFQGYDKNQPRGKI
jgi:hypothetical protein